MTIAVVSLFSIPCRRGRSKYVVFGVKKKGGFTFGENGSLNYRITKPVPLPFSIEVSLSNESTGKLKSMLLAFTPLCGNTWPLCAPEIKEPEYRQAI